MVGTVAVAPIARMIWLAITRPSVISALASPVAPAFAALVVALFWAGALLFGRDRGPALHPPVLTHVLASSALSRADAFRGPVLRAGAAVTVLSTVATATVGFSLWSSSLATLGSVAVFAGAGAAVGIIGTVAWLAGQAFPRAATVLASGIVALSTLGVFAPQVLAASPWGWVGASYPAAAGAADFGQLLGLGQLAGIFALTCLLVAAAPSMLNRLRQTELFTQALHWELAVLRTGVMDFEAAAGTYRQSPRLGRSIRAVRPALPAPLRFLVSDAIGAARRPMRLASGVLALVAAGVLVCIALSLDGGSAALLLAAAAGLIAYLGLGPLTDGLRYAANVAADYPLFGISDERLLAGHTLFPLAAIIVVLLIAAAATSLLVGLSLTMPLAAALSLGLTTLILRIAVALKGPLPPAFLTPIPTPAGDLAVVLQLTWAFDGVLLSTGAGAALFAHLPVLLAGIAFIGAGLSISRWRNR